MTRNTEDDRHTEGTLVALEERYGDELLHANWNPVLAAMHCDEGPHGLIPRATDALTPSEQDAFLDRVYLLASSV